MALRRLKAARTAIETTPGTPVTPTRLFYFEEGTHTQRIETIRPPRMSGEYIESYSADPGMEENELEFSGAADYNDLSLHLSMVADGGNTGSGGSADKTWAFIPALTTDDTKAATVQIAYADQIATATGRSLTYCKADHYELTFQKTGWVAWSMHLTSAKAASKITAFTGSLSHRVPQIVLGRTTAFYVDTTTIGSTADPRVVDVSFVFDWPETRHNGLDASAVSTDLYRVEAPSMSMVVNRLFTNETEYDAFVAKTERKIRVRSTGAALGGSNYQFDINYYGVADTHEYNEVEGLGVGTITYLPIYDTGVARDITFGLVNSLAAIT